ncbi:O-antigen ligase family protein [Citrobacter portucalensis]|uniref:O-antigen ligase family protein n=1 Tax=Citrobacter portucalensis TaxID=1639133 RepID=UPI004033232D
MSGTVNKIYLISLFIGSGVVVPMFGSLMNLLLPFSILLNLINLLAKKKFTTEHLLLFFISFLMLGLSVVYSVLYSLEFTSSIYYLHVVNISLIISLGYITSTNLESVLTKVSFAMLMLCFWQLLYSIGIVPELGFIYVRSIYDSMYIVSGGMGNPNNQSVLSLLVILIAYVTFKNDIRYKERLYWIYIANMIVICITLSRTVFVVSFFLMFFIFPIFNRIQKINFLFLSLIVGILSTYVVLSMDTFLFDWLVSRIESIFSSSGGDESVGVRTQAYIYALSNIIDSFIGFGPKNYSEFYSRASFIISDPYFSESPHSFLIELMLSFGVFGIFIVFLFVYLFGMRNRSGREYLFFVIFVLVSNVPSSIMQMPSVFFILYVFLNQREFKREYSNWLLVTNR